MARVDSCGEWGALEVYRIRKSDRQGIDTLVKESEPISIRQRVSLVTVLFTSFGTPCAVVTTLSPLAIFLGFGSLISALSPAFAVLDAAQIRIPLQVFAVLGASINLYVIRYGYSHRETSGLNTPTLVENRKLNFVIGLSVFSLLAVAFETYVHLFDLHMSYFSPSL